MKIKMLSRETIEKIAAGEVIVRPESVVKELVENAVDAGASQIDVMIEEGGKKRIRVTDNGSGIAYNEIPLAFERHATSKLTTIDDLSAIDTLGFRGEALASIAAVSRVSVTTIAEEEEMGSHTVLEGGKVVVRDMISYNRGTDIDVTDLFYNVPARKKHMLKSSKEESAVHDLMERLALSHPEIAFSYDRDGKKVFTTSGNGSVAEVIACLYGKSFLSGMREIDVTNDPMKVRGYIGDITQTRGRRDRQIFFLNGRYVRNRELSHSFESAYEGYLMNHRHPSGILFITLPGHMIDVNMHPAKTVVGILNESLVGILFRQGIRSALRAQDLSVDLTNQMPSSSKKSSKSDLDIQMTVDLPGISPDDPFTSVDHQGRKKDSPVKTVSSEFTDLRGQHFVAEERSSFRPVSHNTDQNAAKIEETPDLEKGENPAKSADFLTRGPLIVSASSSQEDKSINPLHPVEEGENQSKGINFSGCRVVGQLFKTYVLLERENDIIMIDQHAAHEAFYFETLRRKFENNEGFDAQTLLIPVPVDVSKKIMADFNDLEASLQKLGFECDVFGDDALMVRSVPVLFGNPLEAQAVVLFIESLTASDDTLRRDLYYRIATMACKSAIKGNMHLEESEIETLLRRLESLANPFTCPHGRPIILRLSRYALEKLFKRVV